MYTLNNIISRLGLGSEYNVRTTFFKYFIPKNKDYYFNNILVFVKLLKANFFGKFGFT